MEAVVEITKTMMCKALLNGTNIIKLYEALLELRNTPGQYIGVSLAGMMYGRNA